MNKYGYDVALLAEKVMLHRRLYYAGQPQISDQEYDAIEDSLRELAPEHPVFDMIGAPLEGDTARSKKVTHARPMLSLAKTYKRDDLLTWLKDRPALGTYKIDGVSLSLNYENHRLTLAKTRGNGKIGEDVTSKIRWVPDCVLRVADLGVSSFEIRGELFCKQDRFNQLVAEMKKLDLDLPSSPRNIVAGILGRKQHGELARFFNFFAFDLIVSGSNTSYSTEEEKFKFMEQMSFRLPPYQVVRNADELFAFLQRTQDFMENGDLGIDGAVFSLDDLSLHSELGFTSHHPRYKMSFKWQGQTAVSGIRDIIWNTSRLGVVTPVAIVDPVFLSDAKITNITLHNAATIKAYNLKAGDEIEIVRSGEVIPKFLRVVTAKEGDCKLPTQCPTCETDLYFDEVRLICANSRGCAAQKVGSILNWIKCAGIDDLSEKRLGVLIDHGLVSEVSDLYSLQIEDFLKLPLTKETMATKLFRNIQESKNLPLSQFLSGLGIKGLGKTGWELLLERFTDLSQLRAASIEEIVEIKGFALKLAEQVVVGLQEKGGVIDKLLVAGLIPSALSKKDVTGGALEGKQFVITGTHKSPRKKITDAIEQAGGKVLGSVSKNTDVLIIADIESNSSKAVKARQLGLALWDEATLWKQLEQI
ncbi:MAG: NAD-dependent DNA ligase LigA [Oligoflexales bacterium]